VLCYCQFFLFLFARRSSPPSCNRRCISCFFNVPAIFLNLFSLPSLPPPTFGRELWVSPPLIISFSSYFVFFLGFCDHIFSSVFVWFQDLFFPFFCVYPETLLCSVCHGPFLRRVTRFYVLRAFLEENGPQLPLSLPLPLRFFFPKVKLGRVFFSPRPLSVETFFIFRIRTTRF